VTKRDELEQPELDAGDRRLIRAIDAAFRPPAADRAAELAFARRLEERRARRERVRRVALPALASAAAACAALWLSWPSARAPQVEVASAVEDASLYAFIDPDAAAVEGESPSYLPEEYELLAQLVDDGSE
jgi:hypothetical protein